MKCTRWGSLKSLKAITIPLHVVSLVNLFESIFKGDAKIYISVITVTKDHIVVGIIY